MMRAVSERGGCGRVGAIWVSMVSATCEAREFAEDHYVTVLRVDCANVKPYQYSVPVTVGAQYGARNGLARSR